MKFGETTFTDKQRETGKFAELQSKDLIDINSDGVIPSASNRLDDPRYKLDTRINKDIPSSKEKLKIGNKDGGLMTYQIGKVAKPNNVRASEIASTLQHTQHGKTEDAAPSHVDDTSLEEINRQQHVINMIDEEKIQKQKIIVREKSKFSQ